VDENNGPFGLEFFNVGDRRAVGIQKPVFLGGVASQILHVFAGGDADAGPDADKSEESGGHFYGNNQR